MYIYICTYIYIYMYIVLQASQAGADSVSIVFGWHMRPCRSGSGMYAASAIECVLLLLR